MRDLGSIRSHVWRCCVCHRCGHEWRAVCHCVRSGSTRSSFDASCALHMTVIAMTKAAMMVIMLDDGGDDDADSARSTILLSLLMLLQLPTDG